MGLFWNSSRLGWVTVRRRSTGEMPASLWTVRRGRRTTPSDGGLRWRGARCAEPVVASAAYRRLAGAERLSCGCCSVREADGGGSRNCGPRGCPCRGAFAVRGPTTCGPPTAGGALARSPKRDSARCSDSAWPLPRFAPGALLFRCARLRPRHATAFEAAAGLLGPHPALCLLREEGEELGEEEQRSTGRGQEFKKRRRLSEGQLVKQRIQLARRCVDSVLSPHDEAGQPGLLRRTRVEGGTRDGPAAQCVRAHVASSSG
jgi:hypothetical protein